ncbi:MAG: hypothetical protein Kow0099_37420 [Candidatus Abyssubacteria bacterium]
MFEKISGFFKRFTRRRQKRSGETTIMNGKEAGLEEYGLDEGFDELSGIEEPIDRVSTAPAASMGGPDVSGVDAELGGLDTDFSTGASDYDERTISDEISGGTGLEEEAAAPPDFFAEGETPAPFEMPMEEAPSQPVSPVKKAVTLVVVGIICLIVGGVGHYFVWPVVSKLIGGGSDQPKLDLQALVNAEQRKNANLQKELKEFTMLGGPSEVTQLKQHLTQFRDSQGPMSEFESKYNLAKQQEAAYNDLLKKVEDIEAKIADTRADIRNVQADIEQARLQVNSLARQTEQAYERFRIELSRAELSQRMVAELRVQDLKTLHEELNRLERQLSQLQPMDLSVNVQEPVETPGTEAIDSGS